MSDNKLKKYKRKKKKEETRMNLGNLVAPPAAYAKQKTYISRATTEHWATAVLIGEGF